MDGLFSWEIYRFILFSYGLGFGRGGCHFISDLGMANWDGLLRN